MCVCVCVGLTAGSGTLTTVLEQAGDAAPAARLRPAPLRRRLLQGRQGAGQGRLQDHRPAVRQRCMGGGDGRERAMESRAERRERNRKQKEEGEEKERDAEERRKREREGGRE